MCGRFTLFSKLNSLLQQLAIEAAVEYEPRYNIAPTQEVPVFHYNDHGDRDVRFMRWGLIPSWAKDKSIASRMINARSETVATKPAFRSAFKRRRCLVPADGYYEWLRDGKKKIPYLIQTSDKQPFAMAGLWESWHNNSENGSAIESFTIITTTSNDATSFVHDRMPVILHADALDTWLDPDMADRETLEDLLVPFDSDSTQLTQVSSHVNSVKNDDPTCIVEVTDPPASQSLLWD